MSVTVITEAQRVALNSMNDVSKDISLGSVLQNTQTQSNLGYGSVAEDAASTGTADDVALTKTWTIFTNTSLTSISGFGEGIDGQVIHIFNSKVNTVKIDILYNDSGSAAANRIVLANSTSRPLGYAQMMTFMYSATYSLWVEIWQYPYLGTVAEHADNAAALAADLVIGQVYRTGDALKVVHA